MSDDAAEGMAKMSIKDRMRALEAQSRGSAPKPFAGGVPPSGGGRVAALRANVAIPTTPPAASGATPSSTATSSGPGLSSGQGRVTAMRASLATPTTPAVAPASGGGGSGVAALRAGLGAPATPATPGAGAVGSRVVNSGNRPSGGKVAALGASHHSL